jgi:Protein of unknown function (DUF1698)
LGFFDVILFPGVLYHLRYPFWGLKVLRDMMKPDGELLTETAIWPGDSNNAMSPYEPSSCTFFNEKGLVDTLKSLNFDTVEVEFLPGRSLHDQIARARLQMGVGENNPDCTDPDAGATDPECVRRRGSSQDHICEPRGLSFQIRGHDNDSHLVRYWEHTHELHTKHGGDKLLIMGRPSQR